MHRDAGGNPAASTIMNTASPHIHNQHYLNPDTKAGQIMYGQKMKEGKNYEPSPELLQQQYLEQTTEQELFDHTDKALQMTIACSRAIQTKLDDPKTPIEKKVELIKKRNKVEISRHKLLKAVFKHSGKDKEAAQMQEANIALPIGFILESLVAVFAAGIAAVILTEVTTILFDMFSTLDDLEQDIDIGDLIDDIEGVTLPTNQVHPSKNPIPKPPLVAQQQGCDIRMVGRHRGPNKNNTHGLADTVPPNVVLGTDWDLYVNNNRKAGYDALSPTNELWEIKAVYLSQMANDFYKEFILPKDLEQIEKEEKWASHCGYTYILGCVDEGYAAAIRSKFSNIIIRMI